MRSKVCMYTQVYAFENKLSHTCTAYKRSYFFPLLLLCVCVFRHVLWFCFWLWVWWHHSIQFWQQVILFATLAHKALHGQVPCQQEVLQYNLCQHLPSLSTHKHEGLLKKRGEKPAEGFFFTITHESSNSILSEQEREREEEEEKKKRRKKKKKKKKKGERQTEKA